MVTEELTAKANQGDAEAQYKLACQYDSESAEHAVWIRKAAENGHTKAQWRLGDLTQWGDCGVTKNINEAVNWYRKSAEQGNKTAQYSLGECYFRGHIACNSPREAFEMALYWMKKAGTTDEGGTGLADAQYRVGVYYANGLPQTEEGKEPKKSDEWFLTAAENGNATAQSIAGNILYGEWLEQYKKWLLFEQHRIFYGDVGNEPIVYKPKKDNLEKAYNLMKKAVESGKIKKTEVLESTKEDLLKLEKELAEYDVPAVNKVLTNKIDSLQSDIQRLSSIISSLYDKVADKNRKLDEIGDMLDRKYHHGKYTPHPDSISYEDSVRLVQTIGTQVAESTRLKEPIEKEIDDIRKNIRDIEATRNTKSKALEFATNIKELISVKENNDLKKAVDLIEICDSLLSNTDISKSESETVPIYESVKEEIICKPEYKECYQIRQQEKQRKLEQERIEKLERERQEARERELREEQERKNREARERERQQEQEEREKQRIASRRIELIVTILIIVCVVIIAAILIIQPWNNSAQAISDESEERKPQTSAEETADTILQSPVTEPSINTDSLNSEESNTETEQKSEYETEKETESTYETEPNIPIINERGNTVGNIIYAGVVAVKGEWIYYRNPSDNNCLYKIRKDGTGAVKMSDDFCSYINVVGDWVYYNKFIDVGDFGSGSLFKVGIDGNGGTKINDDDACYINVIDAWIYYQNRSDGGEIYKIKTDGTDKTKLNSNYSLFVNVVNDWIYYVVPMGHINGNIYKMRTDGTEETKLTDDESGVINVVGDWIYYSCITETGLGFFKVGVNGENKTKLLDTVMSFNVNGDWIYYSDDGLYKMQTDGTNKTKLCNGDIINISIADDWIYYSIGFDEYKIRVDGSEKQSIN